MHRYRFTGDGPALIPDLHRLVQPGEEFDSKVELNNPYLNLVAVNLAAVAPEKNPSEPAAAKDDTDTDDKPGGRRHRR